MPEFHIVVSAAVKTALKANDTLQQAVSVLAINKHTRNELDAKTALHVLDTLAEHAQKNLSLSDFLKNRLKDEFSSESAESVLDSVNFHRLHIWRGIEENCIIPFTDDLRGYLGSSVSGLFHQPHKDNDT